jgi:cellulose synthase/poly-beta-1,6-N-acetylglucosamine synthase-like glycosyltransferase
MKQELSLFLVKGTAYYFLSINIVYGVLLILSWMKIKRFRYNQRKNKTPKVLPAVSFIIPAFNEETLIVETIQTYISLSKIQKEIIIIDDGSSDKTLKLLQTMFQLQKTEDSSGRVYRSIIYPEMIVVEMPHAGKAEALNNGVKLAKYDLICTMDADTVPTAHGVEACLGAFASNPLLIAAGGIIQILGSNTLKNNAPDSKNTLNLLSSFQSLEYFRTFVCERLGWSLIGSTVLISGAFCMLKKEAVNRVGGFRPDSITEDFDLIVRLRREYHGEKFQFKILPLPVCHTQVPRTLAHLKKQRVRWQMGLVQTLCRHLNLILHPGYGPLGLFAIPYYWTVEVMSPILEGIAWIIIPYCLYEGWIDAQTVLLYLGIGLLFNLFITLMGVHLDRKYISRNKTSYFSATLHSLLIHLGYKQLNSWWRLSALLKSFRKKSTWGEKPREEIIHRI